jgi:hypothetical protein
MRGDTNEMGTKQGSKPSRFSCTFLLTWPIDEPMRAVKEKVNAPP